MLIVMRLRSRTLIGGSLVVILTIAVVTLSIVRVRPMGASIGIHSYEKQAGEISACLRLTNTLTRALQRTAAPLGSWTVQVICQRLLQPTGRFRRRSLSLVVGPIKHDTRGE
jgi:hypothetical protein